MIYFAITKLLCYNVENKIVYTSIMETLDDIKIMKKTEPAQREELKKYSFDEAYQGALEYFKEMNLLPKYGLLSML